MASDVFILMVELFKEQNTVELIETQMGLKDLSMVT